tara:strand:+ start:533 stop:697 length:165 start_codon:yes stop_codon:yes gene_type:complete
VSPFLAATRSTAPPDPGAYHKEEDFNKIKCNIGMGAKYEFKADSNPPVGGYEVD